MSVFTTVTFSELRQWLKNYAIGDLRRLKGITKGVTNTNYFVTTSEGEFVLTLFENESAQDLQKFLELTNYLSEFDIPCPFAIKTTNGVAIHSLNGKPASLFSKLLGKNISRPNLKQCEQIGLLLAKFHLAGKNFPISLPDNRGTQWRKETSEKVNAFLSQTQKELLQKTLSIYDRFDYFQLPQGVIHADLFCDNALFEGDSLSGIIDFYYACQGAWLYDLAIVVNDWSRKPSHGLDMEKLSVIVSAYHAIRPLIEIERNIWGSMLKIAALRFWLSRLDSLHYPTHSIMTETKDPQQFEGLLRWLDKYKDAL